MTNEDSLKARLYHLADGTKDNGLRVGFGTPGKTVKISGTKMETGQCFEPGPSSFGLLVKAVGEVLDDQRDVLNHAVDSLNQFLEDYNNGVVPSTAKVVSKLP